MEQASQLQATSEVRFNRFLATVYLIMAVGMVVTAAAATYVYGNPALMKRILFDSWFVWGLFLLQIIIVAWLSAAVMRMSAGAAFLLFLLYSFLTGIMLSSIFIYYSSSEITYAFWGAAGMFLLGSIAGFFVKGDLSAIGRFLMLILLGWLFGWILVWLFPSPGLDRAMNFTGIVLFAALTVWDTQRLRQLSTQLEGRQGAGGLAVVGALALYLDFINLFLLLLRTSRR
jgi:uncharacterized protein